MPNPPELPTVEWYGAASSLEGAVRSVQEFILEHPVAAQAIYQALVAEGRRHASTPEGARRFAELSRSVLVHRLREVWEPASFNLLETDTAQQIPTGYLEALILAMEPDRVEALLRTLAAGSARGPR